MSRIHLHRGGAGFEPEPAASVTLAVEDWADAAARVFAEALESKGWHGSVQISVTFEPLPGRGSRHEHESTAETLLAEVRRV